MRPWQLAQRTEVACRRWRAPHSGQITTPVCSGVPQRLQYMHPSSMMTDQKRSILNRVRYRIPSDGNVPLIKEPISLTVSRPTSSRSSPKPIR